MSKTNASQQKVFFFFKYVVILHGKTRSRIDYSKLCLAGFSTEFSSYLPKQKHNNIGRN